jgi:hypothetical protein
MMKLVQSCCVIILLCGVGVAQAEPVTEPIGVPDGTQIHIGFITSTSMAGTSSNIDDYNAFATSVANGVPELAALGTTWNVVGSTGTVDARDNTGTNPTVSTGVPILQG